MSRAPTELSGILAVRWRSVGAWSLAVILTVACADAPRDILPHSRDIAQYVAFLAADDREGAVDYVLGLFDEADVVVLCERAHPEITQYEFILKVISDPRFIERVGHVFTEIGTITAEPEITEFLLAEGLTDADMDAWRRRIYRDFSEEVQWSRYNYYDLLGRLYQLNQSLRRNRKIRLHPVGLPFGWRGMTKEAYADYMASKGDRDRRMAEHIVQGLRTIEASRVGAAKALVIMNYRHAFPHLTFPDGGRLENTTGFLFEMLPGRVRNVMINSIAIVGGTSEADLEMGLVQDGRWDAAFAVTGNWPVGFNLAGSPFGRDSFDFFPFGTEGLRYQDVFSGFVFYEPVSAHRLVNGIPGLVDEAFLRELERRLDIVEGYDTQQERQSYLEGVTTYKVQRYDEVFRIPAPFEEQMKRWMEEGRAQTPR